MVKMNTIAGLVVLCMVSAVAAFFLPNAVGTMLSFVSIGAAAAIGVLAIVASCGCSPSAVRSDTGPSTCHPTPSIPAGQGTRKRSLTLLHGCKTPRRRLY